MAGGLRSSGAGTGPEESSGEEGPWDAGPPWVIRARALGLARPEVEGGFSIL